MLFDGLSCFSILVDMPMYSVMWLQLLMVLELEINVNLRLSVYDYHNVECAFTLHMIMTACVEVMCCMHMFTYVFSVE